IARSAVARIAMTMMTMTVAIIANPSSCLAARLTRRMSARVPEVDFPIQRHGAVGKVGRRDNECDVHNLWCQRRRDVVEYRGSCESGLHRCRRTRSDLACQLCP